MEGLLQIGVIANTHGISGEVKVYPTTDDIQRFRKLKHVILDTGLEKMDLEVCQVKFFKKMAILKFKEFNNINEVEKYKGKSLYVTRENAVPLQDGEFFIADMIGIAVHTVDGEDLGVLTDVIQTGANDVYVIGKQGEMDLLLPAIKECIREIDIKNGKMTVYLMPGLRD